MRRVLAAVLLLGACGAVQRSNVRPDYDAVDRTRIFRLVVLTAPLPGADPSVGTLWSLIARRYVNQHRDFIVRRHVVAQTVSTDACGEGDEGILRLLPAVSRRGGEVTASVVATLWRCSDRQTIWEAEARGAWPEHDPNVRELTSRYVEELGEGVGPYVPTTFHLLRETLDTLPRPKLVRDEDVMDKIELGE